MPTETQSLKDSASEVIGSGKYLAELISAGAGLVPVAIGLWGWWSNSYNPIPWFLGAFVVAGFLVISLFIALNRMTVKYNQLKTQIASDPAAVARSRREEEVRRLREFQRRLAEISSAVNSHMAGHITGHAASAEQIAEYKEQTNVLVKEADAFLESQDLTWFAALRPGGGTISFESERDQTSDQISRAQYRLKERLAYLQSEK